MTYFISLVALVQNYFLKEEIYLYLIIPSYHSLNIFDTNSRFPSPSHQVLLSDHAFLAFLDRPKQTKYEDHQSNRAFML